VQTQLEERSEAPSRKRAPRRAATHKATPAWQREQDLMVTRIADHAIAGGAERAGPGADTEQSIDAYLEVLRRDLLAFARRDG
jgi:hypothetical protein